MAPWPAPFSESFVDQARSLLEASGVLVIIAPLGASRQRLAAAIADVPEGPVWFRHVARFGERDRPYFALRQFFPDLGLPDADGGSDGIEEAVLRALDDIEDHRPRLILANAHLCDPESIEILVRLARDRHVGLVVTLTPEVAADQDLLLSAGETIDIPPLDAVRVGDLLRARFGAHPHPLLVDLLLNRTGGSYAAVRDLADSSFADGLITIVEGLLVTSPSAPVADSFDSRLAPPSIARLGGGEEITDLIELAALLGQLDLEDARACVPPEVIELARSHGTFTLVGERLVFAWQAEETLVMRSLPVERHRQLFDKYADRVPRTLAIPAVSVRAADWWLAVGQPLPVELAFRAAREANLMGRHRRAVVYTDPMVNEDRADVALTERAFAFDELGDHEALRTLLSTMEPDALTEDELLPYMWWLSTTDAVARGGLIERAVASDDPAVRRRRTAVRTLAELLRRAMNSADDDTVNRLRALAFSSQLSPCNRAAAFAALSAVLRQSGRPAQSVGAAEFALRILAGEQDTVSAFHLDLARALHVMALVSALDLEGAEHAAREYSFGGYSAAGNGRLMSALQVWIAVVQGDVHGALASARLCLAAIRPRDPHQIRGWVEAMLAYALMQCDRIDEAQELIAAAERHRSNRRQIDLERRMALAVLYDALAEPEEALHLLSDVSSEASRHGLRLAMIESAVLSVQIGGPPHLRALLDVVEDLVDPSGTPQVWQTFADAVQRYDLDALVELAEDLFARGLILFAAEVAQYVLDMARRRTDLDERTRSRLREMADPDAGPHA